MSRTTWVVGWTNARERARGDAALMVGDAERARGDAALGGGIRECEPSDQSHV